MQRARPEGHDGAARTRSQTSLPQVDVIVLTADPALLATLREASGPVHRIFHVESPEAAVDLLVGGRCGLFIVDIAVVRRNVADLIDKLQAQFPEVLVLATGRRDEQHAVAGLVTSGRVYRFLHKPISPARAELFLSTATRRYGELHPYDARSNLASRPRTTSLNRAMLMLAAVTIAVIATGSWLWMSADRGESAPETAPTGEANSASALPELLARADAARSQGNVAPPAADNALDLYRAALRIDTTNAHARQAIERIVATLEQNTIDALAAHDAPRARNAFTRLQHAAPDHPRLDELQAALFALARQASATAAKRDSRRPPPARAVRSPASARTSTPNLDAARAFLASGHLIEPRDANALKALRQARAARENENAIRNTASDLGRRLLDVALAALDANDLAGAKAAYETALAVDREFDTRSADGTPVAGRIRELDQER